MMAWGVCMSRITVQAPGPSTPLPTPYKAAELVMVIFRTEVNPMFK